MTVARAPPDPTDYGGGARFRDPNTLGRHRATLGGGRARPWAFGTRRGRLLRPPLGDLGSESSRTDHELCSCLFACLFTAVGAQQGMCS